MERENRVPHSCLRPSASHPYPLNPSSRKGRPTMTNRLAEVKLGGRFHPVKFFHKVFN
jgi:hypothetical protein